MALGMIEVYGFATAIVVADAMAKAADVKVVAIDKNKPAGGDSARVPLVMAIKVEGSAAAVDAAVSAGKAEAEKRELYITHKVIARQSEDIEWFAHLSALGKDKLR
jgi:microcompartment protein CcmL/EutN